jgi:hypothetical protein
MASKSDLIELARICVKQTRLTNSATVVAALSAHGKGVSPSGGSARQSAPCFGGAALTEIRSPVYPCLSARLCSKGVGT